MSWSGFDNHGNWFTIYENASPEDYASCMGMIAALIGIVACGVMIWKCWPIILACIILSFIFSVVGYRSNKLGLITLLNWIWMSVAFIVLSVVISDSPLFDLNHLLDTICGIIWLIADIILARLFAILTSFIARKIFANKDK